MIRVRLAAALAQDIAVFSTNVLKELHLCSTAFYDGKQLIQR
jgi:hypothetical protein